MADEEQETILKQGADIWNEWREQNPDVKINLCDAELGGSILIDVNLNKAQLIMANLRNTNMSGANLTDANLTMANLNNANIRMADLCGADLRMANLVGADLRDAKLCRTNLTGADFICADLKGADLSLASLVITNLEGANLEGCRIYGISAWDLKMKGSNQNDLIINKNLEFPITVDNLELAQFIYLLLNNQNLRNVIDTITSKGVLILGNFNTRCKPILDSLRQKLREHGFVPMMFDFATPKNRDMTETVKILAHMSKFIIADVSEQKSTPHELASVVPDLAVPLQIITRIDHKPYAMIDDLMKYPWVMKPLKYNNQEALESYLDKIIYDALVKFDEIKEKRFSDTSGDWTEV